jgi:tetratricopeptide (TPR) repeat protein
MVAPQLFGGAFPWTILVISGLCLASLGMALLVRRSSATPVVDGVFIMMGVAWLWTCLQAVPLPATLARALDLTSVPSLDRLQGLAWADSVPFTISYDPGSTYLQILVGVGILSSFLAARLGGPGGLKPIAAATVVSATLLGLVGVAHEAAGVGELFGIYAPQYTSTRLLAPLMNGNHLAGFCLMGALLAVGLAGDERDPTRRTGWVSASVFCTLVSAWTLSRGAIGALLFGFLLLAAWFVSRSGRRENASKAAIPVAVAVAAIAGVVAFAGLAPILRRFETQGFDKLQLGVLGLRLLEGPTWWLGIGRGAFSAAFVAHEGSLARATHPENLLVQWTTEWGIPVATLLLVVLVSALWNRFRTAQDPIVAAVGVAVFALSLQNLVDFSLEMAGVVVVVAALLGALLPAASTSHRQRSRKVSLAAFGVFALGLALLGPLAPGSDTLSIVGRLTRAIETEDAARFESTLRRGLALHPGEPALALLAATHAAAQRHPDTGRWLSIAMEEAPGWGAPHAVAARWLFASGRTDQALLEVREAERRDPGRGHAALCKILERHPSLEYIERAAPTDQQRITHLDRTTRCRQLPADLRADIDHAILESDATHPGAVLREVRRLTAQGRPSDTIPLLQVAVEGRPRDQRLGLALVETYLKLGSPERAQRALQEVASGDPPTRPWLVARARVQAALGEVDGMRTTLSRLRGQAQGQASNLAISLMLEGELEGSLGNVDEALAAYEAADAANSASAALQRAARLAIGAGRPSSAARIYRTLCERQPESDACAQAARFSK